MKSEEVFKITASLPADWIKIQSLIERYKLDAEDLSIDQFGQAFNGFRSALRAGNRL